MRSLRGLQIPAEGRTAAGPKDTTSLLKFFKESKRGPKRERDSENRLLSMQGISEMELTVVSPKLTWLTTPDSC